MCCLSTYATGKRSHCLQFKNGVNVSVSGIVHIEPGFYRIACCMIQFPYEPQLVVTFTCLTSAVFFFLLGVCDSVTM